MNEDTKYNEWFDSNQYEIITSSTSLQPIMKFPDGREFPMINKEIV